jgi:hypothetical protein
MKPDRNPQVREFVLAHQRTLLRILADRALAVSLEDLVELELAVSLATHLDLAHRDAAGSLPELRAALDKLVWRFAAGGARAENKYEALLATAAAAPRGASPPPAIHLWRSLHHASCIMCRTLHHASCVVHCIMHHVHHVSYLSRVPSLPLRRRGRFAHAGGTSGGAGASRYARELGSLGGEPEYVNRILSHHYRA